MSDPEGSSGPPRVGRVEDELAVRAQEEKLLGRTAAFEELVRRLEGPLFGFLTVRVGNRAEAEELTQDAFLRAWKNLERYDPRYRFSTWLFTLAKRLAVSRARVRRPGALADEALAGLAQGEDTVARAADREEAASVWRLAAELLSEEQRTALWLRYAEDLSNEEIATILGKRGVTVRVLLFRARRLLAKALDDGEAARSAGDASPARRRIESRPLARTASGGSR